MTYVILSTQPWSDNWVSKHWIAHWLAERGEETYYVEPFRDWGGRKRDFFTGPTIRTVGKVRVVSFASLPYYYHAPSILKPLWRLVMKPQFRRFSKLLEGKSIDLLTFDGRSLPFLPMLPKPRRSAYYCVDPVYVGEEKRFSEAKLMETVDRVIAISSGCKSELLKDTVRTDIEVIPHAIDFKGKSGKSQGKEPRTGIPADLPPGRPIIGYTGSVHDVYVDFAKIHKAASEHPEWTFVFVGPYKGSDIAEDASSRISALMKMPNIHFLGSKPYQQLRRYINEFDVCLIPYRADIPNGWAKRSPVKVLHYLALGKPIVCADVPATQDYEGLIYVYRNDEEFVQSIATALDEGAGDDKRQARKELAAARDCDIIIERLISVMD